jgi:hypothetical protein
MVASTKMLQVALRHGGACDRCTALARLLIATPCAHLLCVGCAGGDRQEQCSALRFYLICSVLLCCHGASAVL